MLNNNSAKLAYAHKLLTQFSQAPTSNKNSLIQPLAKLVTGLVSILVLGSGTLFLISTIGSTIVEKTHSPIGKVDTIALENANYHNDLLSDKISALQIASPHPYSDKVDKQLEDLRIAKYKFRDIVEKQESIIAKNKETYEKISGLMWWVWVSSSLITATALLTASSFVLNETSQMFDSTEHSDNPLPYQTVKGMLEIVSQELSNVDFNNLKLSSGLVIVVSDIISMLDKISVIDDDIDKGGVLLLKEQLIQDMHNIQATCYSYINNTEDTDFQHRLTSV